MLAAALALSMGVSAGTAVAQDALKVPAPPPPDKLNLGLPAARQAYAPDPAESFMQTWNAYYRSEDGHHVFANVAVSHLGLGSTCGLNLAVTTPDGRTLLETEQRDAEEELRASKSRISLRCGKTHMSGTPEKLRIRAELPGMAMDVTIEQGPPGVDLGALWLDADRERFARYNVPHLGSRMKGRLKYDGTWRTIEGAGFLEHFVTNHGLQKFSRIWHRLRLMEDGTSLMIGGFTPNNDDAKPVYFMFLARGDRVIHVSNRVRVKTLKRRPHAESGYLVPTHVEVRVDDPRFQLKGTMKSVSLIGEFDVLQQLNPIFRVIVRTFFANPWIFRNRSRVDVEWSVDGGPTQRLGTEGMHEIIYVNE